MSSNVFYAQSGGVTAVINASCCGVIEAMRTHQGQHKLFIGQDGILGAIHDRLVDASTWSPKEVAQLKYTPGSLMGSCRYKLKGLAENEKEYRRIIEVLRAHDIGVFLYNGGNDSQDTTHKIEQMSQAMNYPLRCIGIPKTIDNDLVGTDVCPGFGSAAKYIATSTLEASLDIKAMSSTSTKVFIFEVMGRHAGWLAAASALAGSQRYPVPHIILLPERVFEREKFLERVQQVVKEHGYCVIVASEGIRDPQGQFVAASDRKDAFGHAQLGGVAPHLAAMVGSELKLKYHWAVADYLQRSARHIASQTDVDQAYALGEQAVIRAFAGTSGVMLTIDRLQDAPYQWQVGEIDLAQVANQERPLDDRFIDPSGLHVTPEFIEYARPFIIGEAYPKYRHGVPDYL